MHRFVKILFGLLIISKSSLPFLFSIYVRGCYNLPLSWFFVLDLMVTWRFCHWQRLGMLKSMYSYSFFPMNVVIISVSSPEAVYIAM
jgi:hypothetical protein